MRRPPISSSTTLPRAAGGVLARTAAGASLFSARSTIAHDWMETPPEALISHLCPFFSRLAWLSTCLGVGYCLELRRVRTHQRRQAIARLAGQILLDDQGGDDRQFHAVAELAENGHGRGQLVVLGGHVVGPLLGHRVGLAGVLALAGGIEEILFGHRLDAAAAKLPGQPLGIVQHRFIFRFQPPAGHHAAHAPAAGALICRKLGRPRTGAGSKPIASRFMR